MTINKIQKGLLLGVVSFGVFVAGCELIVDFDRTRIPVETPDATTPDANTSDSATPDAAPDAEPTTDAGSDADAAEDLDAGDGGEDASDQ